MTLNQLECFSVVAQRLNFTLAADDLFMSQPALSRTILALEQELGIQLFYRTSRSVALTPAGKAFYQESPRILESFRFSLKAAQLAQEGYRGEITLGILRDTFDQDVVALHREMAGRFPDILLLFKEYSHSELLRVFLAGEVDAIVNFGEEITDGDVESILLRRDRQCAIVPAGFPLAQRGSLKMDDLRELDFVVMSRTSSQPGNTLVWKMAAEAGFTPKVVAEAEHVPSLLTLVACGIGVSTLTDDLEYLAKGMVKFIPLVGVPLSHHALSWSRGNTNPSLPFLLDTARQLWPAGR